MPSRGDSVLGFLQYTQHSEVPALPALVGTGTTLTPSFAQNRASNRWRPRGMAIDVHLTRPMWTHLLLLATLFPAAPGVPNFHKVNEGLYRGGQPSHEGFNSLEKLGIRTVIDLRIPDSAANREKQMVESLGMHYVHIPLHGGEVPIRSDIDQVFSILLDAAQWPVFVHCREGKDRTGMIIACYRISHDGWTNMRALAEAKSYAFRQIKPAMESYINQYRPASQPPR